MKLYDTHCHFERADPAEIAAILARAKAAGVEKLMAVGGSPALNESAALAAEIGNRERGTGNREEMRRVGDWPEVLYALGRDREQINRPDTCSLFPVPHFRRERGGFVQRRRSADGHQLLDARRLRAREDRGDFRRIRAFEMAMRIVKLHRSRNRPPRSPVNFPSR